MQKIEGIRSKEQWKRKIDNQDEQGLCTLEKERNIEVDLASFSSNIDISFHQLTEQYDTGSLKSLLMNTLKTSVDSTLNLESSSEQEKNRCQEEEIESDESEDEIVSENRVKSYACKISYKPIF